MGITRINGKSVKYRPRMALGKRLVSIRNKAIRKGMKLLREEEILEKIERGES